MAVLGNWRVWLFLVCLSQLIWSIAGLMANPDFAFGDRATAVSVLGVDFNGWHAVAGIAIWAPGVVAALREEIAVPYVLIAIPTMLAGLIGLVDDRPLNLFYFPNLASDMVLHVASASVLALLLLFRHRSREAVPVS